MDTGTRWPIKRTPAPGGQLKGHRPPVANLKDTGPRCSINCPPAGPPVANYLGTGPRCPIDWQPGAGGHSIAHRPVGRAPMANHPALLANAEVSHAALDSHKLRHLASRPPQQGLHLATKRPSTTPSEAPPEAEQKGTTQPFNILLLGHRFTKVGQLVAICTSKAKVRPT